AWRRRGKGGWRGGPAAGSGERRSRSPRRGRRRAAAWPAPRCRGRGGPRNRTHGGRAALPGTWPWPSIDVQELVTVEDRPRQNRGTVLPDVPAGEPGLVFRRQASISEEVGTAYLRVGVFAGVVAQALGTIL